MTGLTREHKMFLAIGNGANGKNILLDTVQRAMGDYCQTISPDTLMASRNAGDAERPSPALAMLAGARLAVSSESKEGAKLDVALVKRHTGGGAMTARHLHRNNFTFEVSHKLVLMTNHQPALDGMDDALRGRLHLIPFDVSWNRPGHPSPDPNRPDGDKGLMDTLMAEGLGILAWLVRGAVDYAAHGLEPPDEVAQTTVNYFKGQDPVSRWLETCGRCDAREGALASALYGKYREWCSIEGVQGGAASQTAFSLALKKLGVERKAVKAGIAYGIRVFDVEG
jgi:putative DNA primase/helicase